MAVTLSTLLLSFLERLQQTAFKTFMKSAIPHLLPWLQHRVVTVHGATARSEIPLRNHRDSDSQLSLVRGLADVLLSRFQRGKLRVKRLKERWEQRGKPEKKIY
ncbi:hypothetical protein JHK85_007852 [Glycine max]|nr:hypothetical protein JHK85_007852 [Glycine max]